jgi:cytochrome c-type biogenesis protein CcmF
MIADFGYGVIVIAFVVALYSVGAAIYGERTKSANWVESARRAMLLLWPLISLSALSLIYLLITNHFEVSFVYEVTSRAMPTYLKITAWWGGQAGSLVFWSWLMAAFASLVTLRKWDRDREFLPWVIVVTSITTAFFLGLVVFYQNPFAFYWSGANGNLIADALGNPITSMFAPIAGASIYFPSDGNGLNPLLRHPGMIIHPPMLYLGFVSFVIPFAFAIAALITGRTDDRWIRITRRWTLFAWLFLSCGLVLGSRWAYDVLGWGGFWGWDPVEIAALMPWLTGTAFLHSVMIQEKRGMLKQWNMLLIILTYSLVIFGTFLTRTGVLSSVHAFAQSAIGPVFFVFIGITFVGSVALLIYRWPDLRGETEMKSMLSREALFLLNNLLFISVLVVCFWGVVFPLISQLVTGQTVTVGPPFYQTAVAPLFAALMLLMGVAPLSAWGHSSLKTLGRAIWKSALAALVITIILFFAYTNNLIALVGFFLVALVLFVTVQEFWRATSARMRAQNENLFTAFWRLVGRDRRRYGGYVIHISMMLMAIGILGINLFQVQTQGTIPLNNSLSLSGYSVKYDSVAQFPGPNGQQVTRAVVSVYQGNNYLGDLYPRIDYYPTQEQNMTIPGERSTLKDDLYIILVDWQPASTNGATFKIFVNPLVNWLWIGAILFLFGIIIAAWPDRDAERVPARTRHIHQTDSKQTSAAD